MKALRALRTVSILGSKLQYPCLHHPPAPFSCSFSAQPQENDSENDHTDVGFDSSHYTIPSLNSDATTFSAQTPQEPTWDAKYREKADRVVLGKETQKPKVKILKEQQDEERHRMLARALLEAALEKPDDEVEEVREEDQKSLAVGIIGAPNAGKSSLTNYVVGTKVSAVSRKTNTTTHEVLGVMTKGETQMCFFDTPGLTLRISGHPYKDIKTRVESAWSGIELYDVLMVLFDVHRHLTRPDPRVIKLIERLGARAHPKQKRVLCMNKVDLVEKKKDLLNVVDQFKDLPGYDRLFMISALKGAGIKNLTEYLMQQAVKRPWDEDPLTMTEEVMKNISLEVVREKLLDHIHQEIPYTIEHRLMDWKELNDGSIRIEQHFITRKKSQRGILLGKNGSKIGRIGLEANEELRSIFKKEVHLILGVRVKTKI